MHQKKVFVLGASFPMAEQFLLVRELKKRVINFLETERHCSYKTFLGAGNGGIQRRRVRRQRLRPGRSAHGTAFSASWRRRAAGV